MKSQAARKDNGPDWDGLYETAAAQEGLFTTAQAAEAGYSPQLIAKHIKNGRFARVRRSVYRLVHFPPGEHEDIVAVWLWSGRACVSARPFTSPGPATRPRTPRAASATAALSG